MKLTNDEVKHTAKLAMLRLSEKEEEAFAEDLSAILEYAKIINEADTENAAPLTHVMESVNIMRADETQTPADISDTLSNAPDSEQRAIKVPKIL